VLLISFFCCCSSSTPTTAIAEEESSGDEPLSQNSRAIVTAVSVSGPENGYTFAVTIESPDTGCDRYANWWEIVSLDGNLIFRRVLGHSHVNEQPFTRSGGTVAIGANEEVYIRAHMNSKGYGDQAFIGSVRNGFSATTLDADFSIELEDVDPLPANCAF